MTSEATTGLGEDLIGGLTTAAGTIGSVLSGVWSFMTDVADPCVPRTQSPEPLWRLRLPPPSAPPQDNDKAREQTLTVTTTQPEDGTLVLQWAPCMTLAALKTNVSTCFAMPFEEIVLQHKDFTLYMDNETLESHGVEAGDVVRVIYPGLIVVRLPTNLCQRVTISRATTVRDLKALVCEKEGYPMDTTWFTSCFKVRMDCDSMTLAECGIHAGHTVEAHVL